MKVTIGELRSSAAADEIDVALYITAFKSKRATLKIQRVLSA